MRPRHKEGMYADMLANICDPCGRISGEKKFIKLIRMKEECFWRCCDNEISSFGSKYFTSDKSALKSQSITSLTNEKWINTVTFFATADKIELSGISTYSRKQVYAADYQTIREYKNWLIAWIIGICRPIVFLSKTFLDNF